MKLTKKDECSYSISNAIRTLAMGSVDKKDTLMFEKKNIFFQYATLLLKISIISITQVYVICKKKSRYRETPTAI